MGIHENKFKYPILGQIQQTPVYNFGRCYIQQWNRCKFLNLASSLTVQVPFSAWLMIQTLVYVQ